MNDYLLTDSLFCLIVFFCFICRAGDKQQEAKDEANVKKPAAPAGGGPELKEDPIVKVENNGSVLIVKFIVKSSAKPTAMWTAGGLPVKSAGRYFLDVRGSKQDKEEYTVSLECKSVSCHFVQHNLHIVLLSQ